MHFWIDKRSQQCGFGRSRVAASLSGSSGGVGMGGFGHPPRRMGGYKSTSITPATHRQQQQQQQSAATSSTATITTTADCHSTSRNYHHHVSNNNNYSGNINSYQQQHPPHANCSMAQYNLNNNSHQQQQQQHHSHTSYNQNNLCTNTTNIINNNNATATAAPSAAVLTGAGTVVPVTTHLMSGRSARHNHRNLSGGTQPNHISQTSQSSSSGNSTAHHYDMRSYHHPQFGNMSVRHPSTTSATTATATNNANASVAPTVGTYQSNVAASYQQRQQPAVSQHIYSHAQAQNIEYSAIGFGPQQQTRTVVANYAPHRSAATTATPNLRTTSASTHSTMVDADSQILPSHLKCGMCASLVLASVFVAGAKFYFDHQGTGLEVLIFCAFSATFFLAACTVSLCRVPKSLVPQQREGGVNGEHGRTLCPAASSSVYGQQSSMHELQERTAVAQSAGPPPYHIAILLPESKELPLDESPPPSYDKILI